MCCSWCVVLAKVLKQDLTLSRKPTLEEEDIAEWTSEMRRDIASWTDVKANCQVLALDFWKSDKYTIDGVHPTQEGHQVLGMQMVNAICSMEFA